MKTTYSLYIGVALASLLTVTLLFSANAQAGGRNHIYGNQHNYYYGEPDYRYYDDHGHHRHHRHHRHHHRHHHHRHHHYDNYYPQVRSEVYYGPQYYQPPQYGGGYREIYYGGRNDFFMGLRSGNASIMIGY